MVLTVSVRSAKHSSASPNHYSPVPIVEAARFTLGTIDLDPFSDEFGNRVVGAENIYDGIDDRDGFVRPWSSFTVPATRCLVNVPGGSLPSPLHGTKSSQAAGWAKAVEEWRAGRASAVVFIGFSLELLQACQLSDAAAHPLEFPCCLPARRVRFDVRARDRREALLKEVEDMCVSGTLDFPPTRAKRLEALRVELAEIEGAAERDERWPGDSPTHGNLVVLLPSDAEMIRRFREAFKGVGFCR